MFDNTVTRFPPGLNNNRESGTLSDMYVPDRIGKVHEYSQDFDQFIGGDWVSTGAGTAALVAGDGGLLAITSAVSAFQSVQKTPAHFTNTKAFRTWFRHKAQLDSLLGTVLMGLLNVTVTPLTPASQTDGIYFTSVVTTGALSGNISVGGVITTVALVNAAGAACSIVPGSFFTLEAYYDGGCYNAAPNGRIIFQASGPGVNGVARAEIALPAGTTFPGATNLTETLVVNATTAVARVLTVDQVYTAKDQSNINATPAF